MISKLILNKKFDPNMLTFETSITHFTKDSKATVDYIWYNYIQMILNRRFNKKNTLKPFRILETIDAFTFMRHQGIFCTKIKISFSK